MSLDRCLLGWSCGLCFTRRLALADLLRADRAAAQREQRRSAAYAERNRE